MCSISYYGPAAYDCKHTTPCIPCSLPEKHLHSTPRTDHQMLCTEARVQWQVEGAPSHLAASFLQHLCILHRLGNLWENADFAGDGHRELLVSQQNWGRLKRQVSGLHKAVKSPCSPQELTLDVTNKKKPEKLMLCSSHGLNNQQCSLQSLTAWINQAAVNTKQKNLHSIKKAKNRQHITALALPLHQIFPLITTWNHNC